MGSDPAQNFRDEAHDLLEEFETLLLELEKQPTDRDLIDRAFRAMHTIKGSGAMFGFDDVAAFVHEIEAVFDAVRAGRCTVTPALIELTLAARDQIRLLIGGFAERPRGRIASGTESGPDLEAIARMMLTFRELAAGGAQAAPVASTVQPMPAAVDEAAGSRQRGLTSPVGGAAASFADGGCGDESRLAADEGGAGAPEQAADGFVWRIAFQPDRDLFRSGTNPLGIIAELAGLGPCRTRVHDDAVPELSALDPESCYLTWDLELDGAVAENAIRDAFIFVEDRARIEICRVPRALASGAGAGPAPGPAAVGAAGAAAAPPPPARADGNRAGDPETESGWDRIEAPKKNDTEDRDDSREGVPPAGIAGGVAAPVPSGPGPVGIAPGGASHPDVTRPGETADARRLDRIGRVDDGADREGDGDLEPGGWADRHRQVRVASDKLDRLVSLISELVAVQARLSQTANARDDAELSSISEELDRLTGDLRDSALKIRMVPVGQVFGRLRRVVQDLAMQAGREVELVTTGATTELDKHVIERLTEPLLHLLRNAILHGIEPPTVRRERGKPGRGVVTVAARHSGGHFCLDVADDGSGIDLGMVGARAAALGLLPAGTQLAAGDLLRILCTPGFSGAATGEAGAVRGMGLDVVKRVIEELRGTLSLETTPGAGTIFRIQLPLTLAIIEGLLVAIGAQSFVLPLAAVEECIELTARDEAAAYHKNVVMVRGAIVPYIRLREKFAVDGTPPAIQQIVIARVDQHRIGFVVDQVIGEFQTVIKPLGSFFRAVRGIAGATILGDGTVALILDLARIVSEEDLAVSRPEVR